MRMLTPTRLLTAILSSGGWPRLGICGTTRPCGVRQLRLYLLPEILDQAFFDLAFVILEQFPSTGFRRYRGIITHRKQAPVFRNGVRDITVEHHATLVQQQA